MDEVCSFIILRADRHAVACPWKPLRPTLSSFGDVPSGLSTASWSSFRADYIALAAVAAWRALQTARLPRQRADAKRRAVPVRPGRRIPDSLAGKEGGERFEARLATALPLSEYLVAHLAEEAGHLAALMARLASVPWPGRCLIRSRPGFIASCYSSGSPPRCHCR